MSARRPAAVVAMTPSRNCKRVAEGLRADGWSVEITENGLDVARLLSRTSFPNAATESPDLIVAEAALDGLDRHAISEDRVARPPPLVLIVDYDIKGVTELAHHLGATLVLENPADPEAVREAAAALRPKPPIRDWDNVNTENE